MLPLGDDPGDQAIQESSVDAYFGPRVFGSGIRERLLIAYQSKHIPTAKLALK